MKNSIADRVNDFLKRYPPFNLIKSKNLINISTEVNIIYLEKGDTVFKKNQTAHDYFYVVRDGAISLNYENVDINEITNIHDTGDVFGLRAMITKAPYQLTAVANEESIIYAISIPVFKSATDRSVKIQKYLITSFASNNLIQILYRKLLSKCLHIKLDVLLL